MTELTAYIDLISGPRERELLARIAELEGELFSTRAAFFRFATDHAEVILAQAALPPTLKEATR